MRKILNYQGGKSNLLPVLTEHIQSNIVNNKAFLDVFSGSFCVSKAFLGKTILYSNDLEKYCYAISNAHISACNCDDMTKQDMNNFKSNFEKNKSILYTEFSDLVLDESKFLANKNKDRLINLYQSIPTIWNRKYSILLKTSVSPEAAKNCNCDCLFTFYYSGSYFGIKQAIEIDSIHYAICKTPSYINKDYLYTILFSAINHSSFSKDGHMAQPLNLEKNYKRLLVNRSFDIAEFFFKDIEENGSNIHYKEEETDFIKLSKAINLDIEEILENNALLKEIGCIYADPPYTDMQYSRYYHLLNTLYEYAYPAPTIINGKTTKGLYLNNRNQSKLSQHSTCFDIMKSLINKCKLYSINLIISFGYPKDIENQKTDRYVLNINELIDYSYKVFGKNNVEIHTVDYRHSNHRNHEQKRVNEYIIVSKVNKNGNK